MIYAESTVNKGFKRVINRGGKFLYKPAVISL